VLLLAVSHASISYHKGEQEMIKVVTCIDNVRRPELLLGGAYIVSSSNDELCLIWLVGFEEPFSWSRFAETC